MLDSGADLRSAKEVLAMAVRLGDNRSNAYARAALVTVSSVLAESNCEEIEHHSSDMSIEEGDRTEDRYL